VHSTVARAVFVELVDARHLDAARRGPARWRSAPGALPSGTHRWISIESGAGSPVLRPSPARRTPVGPGPQPGTGWSSRSSSWHLPMPAGRVAFPPVGTVPSIHHRLDIARGAVIIALASLGRRYVPVADRSMGRCRRITLHGASARPLLTGKRSAGGTGSVDTSRRSDDHHAEVR